MRQSFSYPSIDRSVFSYDAKRPLIDLDKEKASRNKVWATADKREIIRESCITSDGTVWILYTPNDEFKGIYEVAEGTKMYRQVAPPIYVQEAPETRQIAIVGFMPVDGMPKNPVAMLELGNVYWIGSPPLQELLSLRREKGLVPEFFKKYGLETLAIRVPCETAIARAEILKGQRRFLDAAAKYEEAASKYPVRYAGSKCLEMAADCYELAGNSTLARKRKQEAKTLFETRER